MLTNNYCQELPKNVINTFLNLDLPTLSMYNHFEIYTDGVKSFEAFMKAINSATKSIYIQTYILKNDTTSRLVINALEKKAAEGIEVKMMINSLGSFHVYLHNKKIFRDLRILGAEIVFFMPILTNPLRNYINYRNHRKIFIFDNSLVIVSGISVYLFNFDEML